MIKIQFANSGAHFSIWLNRNEEKKEKKKQTRKQIEPETKYIRFTKDNNRTTRLCFFFSIKKGKKLKSNRKKNKKFIICFTSLLPHFLLLCSSKRGRRHRQDKVNAMFRTEKESETNEKKKTISTRKQNKGNTMCIKISVN